MKRSLPVSVLRVTWNFLQELRKATIDLMIVYVPAKVDAVHLPRRIQQRYRLSELAQLSLLKVHRF
jgi:hypothetical protein